MKYIRLFESHKNIIEICDLYEIKDYSINNDLSIDVYQDLRISGKANSDILLIKFNKVIGDCYINRNGLKTLKNSPVEVFGTFSCSKNKLLTLKYSPKYVEGIFNCSDNRLTNLNFLSEHIGGSLLIPGNNIKSLKGCPNRVNGTFNCSENKLKSLEYCPKYIARIFTCSDNEIESLEHGPIEFSERYNASNNKLTTLKGMSKNVNNADIQIISGNNLPSEINDSNINIVIEYQDEYKIWNKDNSLNLPRFNLMIYENS